ncbi:MAG: LUD domain-containing protein [Deinococcales bacterium]
MSSRDVVLRRVREALGHAGSASGEPAAAESVTSEAAEYRRVGELDAEARADLFAERAAEYRVRVRRVERDGLPSAIRAELEAHGVRTAVAPADVPEAWRVAGVHWRLDGAPGSGGLLDTRALDATDAVVTGCALAVAETGSLVFDGGERQGRRLLTLLPDLHLCVVREDQVVQTVPEAVTGSEDAARRGAPITWVSGPSATSDIELERVEGVHGPRTLIVLLVR